MDTAWVGIDVSKDWLDVGVRPTGERTRMGRDAEGLASLVARLVPLAPRVVAVEATGGYESVVVATLAAAGLPVVVVNPAQVRAFAQALGKRAKTDPIDADVIAHFVEATKPEVRALPDAQTRALADLVVRRRQIIQTIVAERQRQKRLTEPRLQKSIARLLSALQKELSSIEADIDDAVRNSPAWRAKEDLLTSVPGIGKTIARTLLAELPELGTFDRRRPRRCPGWRRGPDSPASGKARASSAAGAPRCGARSSSAPWSPPTQPRTQGLPRPARRGRQAQAGCPRRHRPQASHHPQCHPPRWPTMAGGARPCRGIELMASKRPRAADGSRPQAVPAGARPRSP